MRIRIIIFITCILGNFMISSGQNPEKYEFKILSVEYDYKSENIVPGNAYSIEGILKIKFEVNGFKIIDFHRTYPNQKDDNGKYFIRRRIDIPDIPNQVMEVVFEVINWGTYFKIYGSDSTEWFYLGSICSNDYVSQTDKDILLGQSKIDMTYVEPEITMTDKSVVVTNPRYEMVNIEIYNISGQLVYVTKQDNYQIEIDKNLLPKGICILQLQIKDNYLTKKIHNAK